MIPPRCVIAIDGPAASGKSTTARMVADALGFQHVDSGALYRAATLARLRHDAGGHNWTEKSVVAAANEIRLRDTAGSVVPVLGQLILADELRGAEVTRYVSRVAQMPDVRRWVNTSVRLAASGREVVVEGRDIGTAVFPDADLKIYLVADPWERARRRLRQHLEREPEQGEIAEETDRLVHRDAQDALQSAQASDAVLIDTTHLTQTEQVERIVALARAVTRRADDTSPVDSPLD